MSQDQYHSHCVGATPTRLCIFNCLTSYFVFFHVLLLVNMNITGEKSGFVIVFRSFFLLKNGSAVDKRSKSHILASILQFFLKIAVFNAQNETFPS